MVNDWILSIYLTVTSSKFKYLLGGGGLISNSYTQYCSNNFLTFHLPQFIFPGVIHVGITCDSCSMNPIAGIRWKCSDQSCPDYDLCTPCYMKDKHDLNHIFTRFTSQKEAGFVKKKINNYLKYEFLLLLISH